MDEEDPWDARIAATGCAAENEALQLCRYDTGDWRQCLKEMQAFRACWQRYNNSERVQTVDAAGASVGTKDVNLIGQVTPDTLPEK